MGNERKGGQKGEEERSQKPGQSGMRNVLLETNRSKVGIGQRVANMGSCAPSSKLLYPLGQSGELGSGLV